MITEIIDRLRSRLDAQRANIDDIADKAKVSRRTLYYILEGEVIPSVPILEKLNNYFERSTASATAAPTRNSQRKRIRSHSARNQAAPRA